MRRTLVMSIFVIALFAATAILAQDNGSPDQPETNVDTTLGQPSQFPTVPPPSFEQVPPGDFQPLTPAAPSAAIPMATVEVALPELSLEQQEALPTLISARADLELLAATALPNVDRPVGWSGNSNPNDPEFPLLLRLDLELLVGATLGVDVRPPEWFGVVATKPLSIARDIRHDLELLADIIMNSPTIRPTGWTGDDPLMRCDRVTQALVGLLQETSIFALSIDFTQPGYCEQLALQSSIFVETNVLQPTTGLPSFDIQSDVGGGTIPTGTYASNSDFTVAFYDRGARGRAGVVPNGTMFDLVGRSYTPFSNMMLVQGENFRVFVEYTFTNVTREEFLALPEAVVENDNTTCRAVWCEVTR